MNLQEEDFGLMIYGSLRTMIQQKRFYKNQAYSYEKPCLTELGQDAVIELVNVFAPKILAAIKEADERRSKEMVINKLVETN